MIIFLFVGAIFIAIASVLLARRNYYKRHAHEVTGRIIGLEKKVNHTRSSNGSSTTTTYCPIVEYYFNGQNIWFSPGSSSSNNIFNYKIGQSVKLLSLDKGPEYVMLKKDHSTTLISIFLALGIFSFIVPFVKGSDSLISNLLSLLVIFCTFISIFIRAKKKPINFEKIMNDSFLKSATIETAETLVGREIYRNNIKINQVVSSIHNTGFIISLVFFLMSYGGAYFFWQRLSPEVKSTIESTLSNLDQYQELVDFFTRKSPNLIGFSVSFLFCLLSTHGLLFSLRKKMG